MERVGAGQCGGAQAGAASGRSLSLWGHLAFSLWGVLLGASVGGWRLAGLATVEMAFGLARSRRGLRVLRSLRLWTLILTAVALGPFLGETADVTLGPLRFSSAGLGLGLEMAGRALALTLAFSLGVGALSLSEIIALFRRLGLPGLGLATGLAMNLLATLHEMATVTWQTVRLRGGLRRPLVGLRLFLITTVANALRIGDQAVDAAAVRAFDPAPRTAPPLPLTAADVWLFALLAGCGAAILAL